MLLRVRFFFQAEDGIRDIGVTGVQTCALPISAGISLVTSGITATAQRDLPHSRISCTAASTSRAEATIMLFSRSGYWLEKSDICRWNARITLTSIAGSS